MYPLNFNKSLTLISIPVPRENSYFNFVTEFIYETDPYVPFPFSCYKFRIHISVIKILWTQFHRVSADRSLWIRAFKFVFQKLIWNIWFTFPLLFTFTESGGKTPVVRANPAGHMQAVISLPRSVSQTPATSHCVSSSHRAPSDAAAPTCAALPYTLGRPQKWWSVLHLVVQFFQTSCVWFYSFVVLIYKYTDEANQSSGMDRRLHQQLLRIRPCGLFQFRITSEIINQSRHLVGLLGRVISLSQGLYQHRTAQHRKTRTNIHALSGIRTRDHNIQTAKTVLHIKSILSSTKSSW
jgi:hypothetical protein